MTKRIIVPKSLSGKDNNASEFVVKALESMKECGGELIFEKGEYHFYIDGTHEGEYYANNGNRINKVPFAFIDAKNITVDGQGSLFVFHEEVFPFVVCRSENITVKNFTMDTFLLPYCEFKILSKDDEGFAIEIDKSSTPYKIEDGHIVFLREHRVLTTAERKLSLHKIDVHRVMYLFAGDSTARQTNLPAPIMLTDAEDRGDTIFFRYRENNPNKCIYDVGELMTINLDEARQRHCFFTLYSNGVTVEDVTVRRGSGVGVLGLCSDNITVKGLKTDRDYHKNVFSFTADAMHFTNCSGKLQILDCDINSFMDDVCNINGRYNFVEKISDDSIELQANANPRFYRPGDIINIINNETLDIVSTARVASSKSVSDDGKGTLLELCDMTNKDDIKQGFLVENPGRMPEVTVKGNRFGFYPQFRISGGNKMVFEDNYLYGFQSAVYVYDLAVYWHESGRVKDLTIRNNVFDNTTKPDYGAFMSIGVSGFKYDDAPVIHDGIKIENNKFYGVKSKVLQAGGVKI